MKKPRCSKCRRPLKDPVSIALGIGPVCRGTSNGGRLVHVRSRRSSGHIYAVASVSGQQMNLFAPGVEEKSKSFCQDSFDAIQPKGFGKQLQATTQPKGFGLQLQVATQPKRIAVTKQARRVAYENHEPFQLGINTHYREPIIYAPISEETWETNDGHQTTHTALGNYLRRFGWI